MRSVRSANLKMDVERIRNARTKSTGGAECGNNVPVAQEFHLWPHLELNVLLPIAPTMRKLLAMALNDNERLLKVASVLRSADSVRRQMGEGWRFKGAARD